MQIHIKIQSIFFITKVNIDRTTPTLKPQLAKNIFLIWSNENNTPHPPQNICRRLILLSKSIFAFCITEQKNIVEATGASVIFRQKLQSAGYKTVTSHRVWSYDLQISQYYSLLCWKHCQLIRSSTMARLEAWLDTLLRRVVLKISSPPVISLLYTPNQQQQTLDNVIAHGSRPGKIREIGFFKPCAGLTYDSTYSEPQRLRQPCEHFFLNNT